MRRIFTSYTHFTTVVFLFVFSVPLLGQQPALPHGVSSTWYQQAVKTIEDREYAIRTMSVSGTYAAVNHSQHLSYWFTQKGYGVQKFNEDGSTKDLWKTQFLLAGIGRGAWIRPVGNGAVWQSGEHRLGFDYGSFSVLYDHEKPGMEQSFVVKKRPAGTAPLRIDLKLGGELDAAVSDDVLRLYAHGDPQDTRLVYDQLQVWDGSHQRLAAHMRLDGRRLMLTVDDSKAVYPVTVDPFVHTTSSTAFTPTNILNSGLADLTAQTLFGFSLAGADLNGDGLSDLVIGSPNFTNVSISGGTLTLLNTTVTGAAFVYYGTSTGPSTVPSKVLQPSSLVNGALFGFSMSTAGNATGGTHAGLVVGAPGQTNTYTYLGISGPVVIGAAYVYNSNSAAGHFDNNVNTLPASDAMLTLAQSDINFSGTPPSHTPFFGWSVADAGDIDGDGKDDIIVGSPAYFESPGGAFVGVANGRVDIFKGSASGVSTTHTTTIYGDITGSLFGYSVNTAGHVNGDATHSSIIIGAPGNLISGSLVTGRAYVFAGVAGGITSNSGAQAMGTTGAIIVDPTIALGSLFGFSVSTAGDVDNDGKDDLIIGAPFALNTGTLGSLAAVGKAYIVYGGAISGGAISSSLPTAALTSPRASQNKNFLFGWSVANGGNVTGDAAGDVLIGEPGSLSMSSSLIGAVLTALGINSTFAANGGQAYVYAGNASTGISSTPKLTVTDASTPNELGYVVRAVGDVDGDGFPDVAFGEPGGSLDLGFNLSSLTAQLPGVGSLQGTLTTSSNRGLLTSPSVGTARMYYGFASGTLPLTLTAFTGEAEGSQTLLNWTTMQEENTSYFQVERSLDGQTFSTIGKVAAAGNSNVQTNYSFVDPSPGVGYNYYRLNMVDLDGQATYSNIVIVSFGAISGQLISVYPNPAHGSFQLLFRNMNAGRYGMNLLNSAGQLVMTRFIQVPNGASYNEMVQLPGVLAAGTYVVQVVDSQNQTYITRIVIE